jgi:hypothetical protein
MIKLLVRMAAWLDRRFPPKVTVTESNYVDLTTKMDCHDAMFQTHAHEVNTLKSRVTVLESQMAALKDALIKSGSIAIKTEADKLRADFIANGRMGN